MLAGGDIVALVTKDARVESWALDHGISVLNKANDIGPQLAGLDFDYLFSVGHLNIIAADVLRCARKMAIKFHDGPLPRYAGFNAPSWAIRNGETRHGVAWHEMTESPDAGRIAARADITIEPDETALSLNAKCYEAGFACFEEILEAIKSGALRLQPQVGKRSYFSQSERPPAAATLDLSQPAHVIAAQVRALHFGPYANPLGFAKLYTGDQLLLVGNAVEAHELGRGDAPGTVLAAETDSVVVATGTIPIRLDNLKSVEGTPFASAANLVPIPPELIVRIDALNQRAAGGEVYWSDVLRRACAVDLPFPRARARAAGPTHHRFQLSAPLDVDSRITAILAWAAKVAGIDRVSMAYRSGAHDRDLGEAALWFSRWRPLSVDLEPSVAIEDAVGAFRRARQQADAAPPMACDLRLRAPLGEGASIGPENMPIAIAVDAGSETAASHGADVIATTTSDTGEVTLYLRASRFDEPVAQVMAAQIRMALAAVEGNGRARLADVELSDDSERELFAHASIGPQKPLIDDAIPDAVAAQAKLTPDRSAIRTRWETLTYAQVQRHVDVAARRLALLGAGPKRTVGVCLERSPELVIILLAVMRTGAAYLPLDPTYPADRIAFMLADSRSSLVITSRRCATRHEFADAQVAFADLLLVEDDALETWEPPPLAGHDLAYLIYTSGSTGQPKGVMISHRSVANFFHGMDAHIARDEPGTWLAVAGPSFDISILELFWTLSRGFTVALHGAAPPATQSSTLQFSLADLVAATPAASREIEEEPQFWIVEDIRHFGATHLQCTPSLASMIAADPTAAAALTSVKYLMVGGEELPLSLALELRRLLPAEAKLLNMYGPTETTIWSTVCALDEISDFIPLGQPIVNTTLRVVGSNGRDQPALVPGELWIGGAGVAMGYWNRPDLTAERFVNPGPSANALMYRTGDIVRRHPDGRLEFLGRRDSQVKVRGHRIELGEIEAALEQTTGIAHAVVVAREEVIGDKRLVAYYVPKPGAIFDDAGLRAALRDRLPEIMIPATYVRMAAFPLTPNGKIDRRALPAPNAIAEQEGATSSDGLVQTLTRLATLATGTHKSRALIPSMQPASELVDDENFVLAAAGRLWAHGVPIGVRALRGERSPRRIPVPTYAFEKQRHGIEPPARGVTGSADVAVDAAEIPPMHIRRIDSIGDWAFAPVWAPHPLTPAVPDGHAFWLVFADESPISKAVLDSISARGVPPVVVEAGKEYARRNSLHFTIRPTSPGDYARLFEALPGRPSHIMHLWSLNASVPDVETGEVAQPLGFDSLLLLGQTMQLNSWGDEGRLCVATSGALAPNGEGPSDPHLAALVGPCRVLPREIPGLIVQLVDLDPIAPSAAAVASLLAEADAGAIENVIAYRAGTRWALLEEPAEANPPIQRLREKGVYLITGGLGGLGLELATYLARTMRARLAFTSREPFPPRHEWASIADDHDHPTSADQIRHLMALEELGAETLVLQADVADFQQVRRAIKAVRTRFGTINGVFHAAGMIDDGLVAIKTLESAHKVLAPKIAGVRALDKLLPPGSVDIFAVFSSTSAIVGPPGQIDYAAANAVLDAIASSRADGLSMSFGIWADVGMAARLVAAPARLDIGPEAHPLLGTRSEHGQTVRFTATYDASALWVLAEHQIAGCPVLPGTAYLEIVDAAAIRLGLGSDVTIRNINFVAPLAFASQVRRQVRTSLTPRSAGEYRCEVESRRNAGEVMDVAFRSNLCAGRTKPCHDIQAIGTPSD